MGLGRHGKTEHSGAKHGKGAFYGRKVEAKANSNKKRRQVDQAIAQGQFDGMNDGQEWDDCTTC